MSYRESVINFFCILVLFRFRRPDLTRRPLIEDPCPRAMNGWLQTIKRKNNYVWHLSQCNVLMHIKRHLIVYTLQPLTIRTDEALEWVYLV